MPIMGVNKEIAAAELADILHLIFLHDEDYDTRYTLVLDAMAKAREAGFPVGIAIDPKEPDWPVVYIELPTGQVSWHMPAHQNDYDGHSTAEKYMRIATYLVPYQ